MLILPFSFSHIGENYYAGEKGEKFEWHYSSKRK